MVVTEFSGVDTNAGCGGRVLGTPRTRLLLGHRVLGVPRTRPRHIGSPQRIWLHPISLVSCSYMKGNSLAAEESGRPLLVALAGRGAWRLIIKVNKSTWVLGRAIGQKSIMDIM